VAVLVPTTLLAQQHYESFKDRFADWPIRIEVLSRFGSSKSHTKTIEDLAEGKVDIVIGTHKILQESVQFKDLGLMIVDEEHRVCLDIVMRSVGIVTLFDRILGREM
jgi:transcription-repair coupling factor (superfamily II helicase)